MRRSTSDLVSERGSRSRRGAPVQSIECGHHQRGSIPGYTGFVPGRSAEDVFGACWRDTNYGARDACLKRGKTPLNASAGSEILAGSIERGSLNCTGGAMDGAGGPGLTSKSLFDNPRGLDPRAGAGVPGYAGHIPGKYAGNVIGRRYAMDNIKATQVRRENYDGKGDGSFAQPCDGGTNWILRGETDRRQHAFGATKASHHGGRMFDESWKMDENGSGHGSFTSSRKGVNRLMRSESDGWRQYEPRATQEFLRSPQGVR